MLHRMHNCGLLTPLALLLHNKYNLNEMTRLQEPTEMNLQVCQ